MKFSLTILGVNSATPAHGRFPTAQILQLDNKFFLIDCGEGAQIRMSDFGIPRHKIHQIFISHLHGDHIFGLPGLLFSLSLNNRKAPLEIFSPPGMKEIMQTLLEFTGSYLPFPLIFHELDPARQELIFENNGMTVHTIPLRHRIPTCGFLFREKQRQRNIRSEKIQEYQLSVPQIKAAKAGENITLDDGRLILNEELTKAPPPPRSIAYVSDTIFHPPILPQIQGVDLLYHEATFLHELLETAEITMHTTARQAAMMAEMAGAGKLVIGHYSSRYTDMQPLLNETRQVFPNTELGEEGKTYDA